MAKYTVNSFSVSTGVTPNGFTRVYLDVNLTNQAGNPKIAQYSLSEDTRATTQGIVNILNQGFSYAQQIFAKVGITEFAERNYLFFDLPSQGKRENHQFTGKKI